MGACYYFLFLHCQLIFHCQSPHLLALLSSFSVFGKRYKMTHKGWRVVELNKRPVVTWEHVHPTKTQISLRIRAVWAESSLSAWRNFASLAIQNAPGEVSDQTARMRRLIWMFAGRAFVRMYCYVFWHCGSNTANNGFRESLSDWASVQADLGLRRSHISCINFNALLTSSLWNIYFIIWNKGTHCLWCKLTQPTIIFLICIRCQL